MRWHMVRPGNSSPISEAKADACHASDARRDTPTDTWWWWRPVL
jgi:hypothetical protein